MNKTKEEKQDVDGESGIVGIHIAAWADSDGSRPVEVDYLYTRFNNSVTGAQSTFRYQAGLVFNFGGK